jgi:uncharacterized protein with GYD domain
LELVFAYLSRASAKKATLQTICGERQKPSHAKLAEGGGLMPKYILLSKLTTEGRKTVRERPNRIEEVDREMEAMQVKVISQHAVVGPYDFVNLVEAPDNETIVKASVELGARGTVQIISMPAIPIEEFIKAIKK